ncbi:MAG: hypothetical protein JOZ23_11615 [Mycobacterium sp.]|nr:hypothetical protein [Mycobacterium sp.]
MGTAAGTPKMPGASPLEHVASQIHPHDGPQHLDFLESARMEREMAREMPQSSQQRSQKSAMSITIALMTISNRRFFTLIAGVLLLTVGLLALRFPVFLPVFDQWGFQINCGSGFQSSLTQAGIADSAGTHLVGQCHTAIAMRRAWTIPLAVAGALILSALLVKPPSTHQTAGAPILPDRSDGAASVDDAITPASGAPHAPMTPDAERNSAFSRLSRLSSADYPVRLPGHELTSTWPGACMAAAEGPPGGFPYRSPVSQRKLKAEMWYLSLRRGVGHQKKTINSNRDEHLSWLRERERTAKLLMSGPSPDCSVGIIVFGHRSTAYELDELNRPKPFIARGYLKYERSPETSISCRA